MESKNKEQYYIVSLDNGIREEEPVEMAVFNSFKDGSKLVQLNDNVFGVYQSNSTNPKTMYIDDLNIINTDIAELLDIDHEESKRIVTENQTVGVFTPLNYSKDIETRISSTTVLNHIVSYIQKGKIPEVDALWITKVLKYQSSKGTPLKDSSQVEDVIKLGIYSLIKEIELQKGTELSNESKDSLTKNYFRMILFDLITGRKHRGLDYNLISKINEQGKPKWIDAYFGPISVTASIENEDSVGENEYYINDAYLSREVLLQVLFTKHYKEIKKVAEALNDAKKIYIDAISRIIYNNTELERAKDLEDRILESIDKVTKHQVDTEKKIDKEHKTNKVERTMATQSLNVRVTTKLDLIQKKYPVNPKDHPELKQKKKAKKEDNIKLTIEDKKKKKNGFATASVLVSIIGLIIGIAIGVAYAVITIGG